MQLLTEQEKSEIIQAIKEAEKQTSCEFVVTEIEQCDDYNSVRFLWGIIFAIMVALALELIHSGKVLNVLLAETSGFIIGFFVLGRIPILKRLLVHRRKILDEVNYRAWAEFYNQGLYKTREENGILIMLSVFEKMVVIMADQGVNRQVTPDYWEVLKNKIIDGIKQKNAGPVIAEVIKSTAEELKKHFPVRPDDKNELSDGVITKN
ncbi:MAG: hypothetical protein AAB019_10270 [Planctomycetota bacterium]